MCGKDVPRTKRYLVERTILNVGPECEKFGKPMDATPGSMQDVRPGNVPLAMEMRRKRTQSRDVFSEESMQVELVDDFGPRILRAREKKGWSRQDLGGRVGEREASLHRIETGALRPTDEVAKKLERELGITLYRKVDPVTTKKQSAAGFTLGDMLKDAMNKNKQKK
jgi:putative transcription factor